VLPVGSSLVDVGSNQLHVHRVKSMNPQANNRPTIILLSGPNQHWHSDSAWFALTQPYLASQYHSVAIDRAGQAFSGLSGALSYQQFSDDLFNTLVKLEQKRVVLVAFASANISVSLFHQKYADKFDIAGILLIDPDILTPDTVAFYQDYPASWYQQNIDKIVPHIEQGKWTKRSETKVADEIEQIQQLVAPENQGLMNWDYYNRIVKTRLTIDGQIARAKSIAQYGNDLALALAAKPITQTSVSVINSDFELANLPPEPQEVLKIKQWKAAGDIWSEQVAQRANGQYIVLNDTSHLVMFERPQVILKALDFLSQRSAN